MAARVGSHFALLSNRILRTLRVFRLMLYLRGYLTHSRGLRAVLPWRTSKWSKGLS